MRRSPLTREDGMAMLAVATLGTALLLAATMVVARGAAQFGNTSSDAYWEQALANAEAGLDWGLVAIEADPAYSTADELPPGLIGSAQEKAWVMDVADRRSEDRVVTTPDGAFVVVKPTNYAVVYSVGYAPDRHSEARRVRVVRIDYAMVPHVTTWVAKLAYLAGGNVEFRGNPTFLTGTAVGIHANGFITLGGSTFASGCVTASGGSRMSGAFTQPATCATPGTQARWEIPPVDPREHWDESQYDLCPDGKVRAGPAHPDFGNTATTEPCHGQTIVSDAGVAPYRGWTFEMCCDASDGARWKYTATAANDGVYYVYEGRANLVSSPGTDLMPWRVTVITEARGVCPGLVGGDIVVSGSPEMTPYPGTGNLVLVAGRDIDIAGNPDFTGLAAAHEQIEVTGDLDVYHGSLLSADWCESSGDSIDGSYVGGNAHVQNDGPIDTEIGTTLQLLTATSWTEL